MPPAATSTTGTLTWTNSRPSCLRWLKCRKRLLTLPYRIIYKLCSELIKKRSALSDTPLQPWNAMVLCTDKVSHQTLTKELKLLWLESTVWVTSLCFYSGVYHLEQYSVIVAPRSKQPPQTPTLESDGQVVTTVVTSSQITRSKPNCYLLSWTYY